VAQPQRRSGAEGAILEAVKRGEKLAETTDRSGQALTQRPFSIDKPSRPSKQVKSGETLMVYHLRNARCQLPSGEMLLPNAKARIPKEDAMSEWLRPHILILDEHHES
jgi:hypothetical protein